MELSFDGGHASFQPFVCPDLLLHSRNHAAHATVVARIKSFPYGGKGFSGETPGKVDIRSCGGLRKKAVAAFQAMGT